MKPDILKIENEDKLVRDTKTNAVLNTDMSSLQKYRAKRERDNQMQRDVDNLKNDMADIKQLLQQIVNREDNK